jgi:hypothetical protein
MKLHLNYGSLEACQRLKDAGIVLETEFFWRVRDEKLIYCYDIIAGVGEYIIPALSMAEVWRELPDQSYIKRVGSETLAWICDDWNDDSKELESEFYKNANPIDALIDLLIWVMKEKDERNNLFGTD